MAQDAAAVVLNAEGMRGIVDDLEVVVVGEGLDGLDVAGVAIHMHRQAGGGARGNSGFDALRTRAGSLLRPPPRFAGRR
jgi:hypothetical protein